MRIQRPLFAIIFLFSLVLLAPFSLTAQVSALSGMDLSQIKVDNLTDGQIQKLLDKATASGLTEQQLEAAALAKGMPKNEIDKLKQRISSLTTLGANKGKSILNGRARANVSPNMEKSFLNALVPPIDSTLLKVIDPRTKIFGYSLFNTQSLTFEPNVNIPTPKDYQLGPGDQVNVDIWGASQQNYQLTIAPDGFIIVDAVGPININGITIDQASSKIISRLTSVYSGIKGPNPTTFAQVSLGNLRSIKVILLGEVNLSGSYTLSSMASTFNALYFSGGPNINGSLRDIEILRNNKTIDKLDIYDFLMKGDKSHDIRLNDQDIIRINTYKTRVHIEGEVKRPLIYEMAETEKLSDLIAFAGGFTDKAYYHRLKVYRNTPREKQIIDVTLDKFSQFSLQNGDSIFIERILKRFENRVEIRGALYRPGEYTLDDSLTLKKLIAKAEGLKGDAFLSRTVIYRTKEDLTVEAVSIDLRAILNGKSEDIKLMREDVVNIPSIFDLREDYFVQIDGEVKAPGQFPFLYNSTLQDVIIMAGGLLESAATSNIEIARRIKNADALASSLKIAYIYYFKINKDMRISDSASLFKLEPFDRISIRRSPGYAEQVSASIEGEVIFPGSYSLSTKVERISDLIKRAGGLTPEAFPKGARLIRTIKINEKERQQEIENLRMQSADSLAIINVSLEKEQPIGIDLAKILEEPGGKYDLILQERDVIRIPKLLQTVRLTGALLSPGTVRYDSKFRFMSYIDNAGGFSDNAKSSKSYVLYANGSIDRTHSFLGIRNYPKVEPGAEIIIPLKAERRRMSFGEIVSFGSATASLALLLMTILSKL